MKVIFVVQYKASFPYIDELAHKLQEKGFEILIFDMVDMISISFSKRGKEITQHFKNEFVKKALKLPKIGLILKKNYYSNALKKNYIEGDHISIHFVTPYYRNFMPAFKKIAPSVSAVVWGSDFYRASKSSRLKIQGVFDECDQIIISNPKMISDFTDYYGKYHEKIESIGFGIGKLDLIGEIIRKKDKATIRKELNLPVNKRIVTIGYNGIKAQQHLLILDAVDEIPNALKEQLFIIIPFGYGGNKSYKKELINKLNKLEVEFKIYDDFISDLDVAKIRISTDLVINAQLTDQASASIQEHLFAGNVLLAGDWLPYQFFSGNGIKFWSFKKDELSQKLIHILSNFEKCKKETLTNDDKIYKLSSWEARIDQWVKAFKVS